jgi:hypothetical protein
MYLWDFIAGRHKMKLWLISQTKNQGYDSFDSAIVVAESEDAARNIHPLENGSFENPIHIDMWVSSHDLDHVSVRYIGEAIPGTKAGVILASFNAG